MLVTTPCFHLGSSVVKILTPFTFSHILYFAEAFDRHADIMTLHLWIFKQYL